MPEDPSNTSSSSSSSTKSVTSTIRDYRELHGRTYHNYGNTEYWGPNDDTQNEQLDIGHHMCTLVLDDRLFLAPLAQNPEKVLDVGTGTGIWAIDFADDFPESTVIGIDISPIQPTWVPPNLKFEIDDVQLEWSFPQDEFDFIHIRCLMGSIDNWPLLYERAFNCTKPGGYIEHYDFDIQFTSDDGTVKEGHTMYDWSQTFIDAGESVGRTFKIAQESNKLIAEAGFVDVVQHKFKLPVGEWMDDPKWKEIGSWCLLYMTTGLEGMALYMLENWLGWTYLESQVLISKMRAALLDNNNHGYCEITLVYGRKPLEAEKGKSKPKSEGKTELNSESKPELKSEPGLEKELKSKVV